MSVSERTKLEQDKSLCHDKMQEAWHDLSKAVSKFHSLEDHYDLDELTIERVDGWVDRIDKSLTDADYLIDELEDGHSMEIVIVLWRTQR
jgi:hypothetical protein